MKEYKLKLKNPNKSFTFDGVVSHSSRNSEYNYLSNEVEGYDYRRTDSGNIRFTQEEIDILPHGLVKLHDIIEVEEDRYNIVCPVTSRYLAYSNSYKKYFWLNTFRGEDTSHYKKQFTRLEIEKSLKCYLTDGFMVKNNSKEIK